MSHPPADVSTRTSDGRTTPAGGPHPERTLVTAARALQWDTMPRDTRAAIQRLFLDWVASAVAGASSRPASLLAQATAGGAGTLNGAAGTRGRGPATMITTFGPAAPLEAALVNAAASHVVEMDDLHNASIYHPATCVFPALLACAEATAATPSRFLAAAVAGYEVSIRVGEALGPEHYAFFHTTGTAGTLGAAVAVGHLLELDERQLLWAVGNAATQAAGLWQFLSEGAMSKQLHTAKAAYNGALAANLALLGFTGPEHGICGDRGLLAATTAAGAMKLGTPCDESLRAAQLDRLLAGTGGEPSAFTEFKTPEVSFKYHASCRHTHPSVDALMALMREQGIQAGDLRSMTANVYTGAYQLLHDVAATTPWAAQFNLPFCLAQAALHGHLTLDAFTEEALADPRVRALMARVSMRVDTSLDAVYPRFWPARVEVETTGGARYSRRIDTPKGDPENPLTDPELDEKFLALTSSILGSAQASLLLARLRGVEQLTDMSRLFAGIRGDTDRPADPSTRTG